jgi:CRP-like cAMP-binding protein
MISPELLRRYPFFSGLSHQQLVVLADAAEEVTIQPDHYFFREEEQLDQFFLNLEGEVAITIAVPDPGVKQSVAGQLTGIVQTTDKVFTTISPGEVFGWSGLVPPHLSSANGKTLTECRVVVFDCKQLRKAFAEDCPFAVLMMEKAAQVIRRRLRDMHMETLFLLAQ